jgi:hypothetical protein
MPTASLLRTFRSLCVCVCALQWVGVALRVALSGPCPHHHSFAPSAPCVCALQWVGVALSGACPPHHSFAPSAPYMCVAVGGLDPQLPGGRTHFPPSEDGRGVVGGGVWSTAVYWVTCTVAHGLLWATHVGVGTVALGLGAHPFPSTVGVPPSPSLHVFLSRVSPIDPPNEPVCIAAVCLWSDVPFPDQQ